MHPETPEEGQSLEELFKGANIDIPQMLEHLTQVAQSLHLPFGTRTKTYNSRLAQELGLWAETKGAGHTFHMAAFTAYFADGKNLAKSEILLEIIKKIQLDVSEAEEVLQNRLFKEAVDRDWSLSMEKKVRAVPTFVVDNSTLTGAHSYNDILRFIQQADPDFSHSKSKE